MSRCRNPSTKSYVSCAVEMSLEIHGSKAHRGVRSAGSGGVLAPRRILGVLALARKHGPALTEDPAPFALEAGAPSYRFLRRYLERVKLPATALKQIDPLIRQLTAYRTLIEQRAALS